jgi:hypothetical protein
VDHCPVVIRSSPKCNNPSLRPLSEKDNDVFIIAIISRLQDVQYRSEPTYERATAMFCVVTDSFPGSSLAVAGVYCRGGFHVKRDTL